MFLMLVACIDNTTIERNRVVGSKHTS